MAGADLKLSISQSNGGEVVKLEKQADMLIADHARKDVPAGSYSWKFVLQSIQNGRLEDKELHLIGRPAGAARTAGSAQPTKGTRRAFTVEDDEILAAWVLQRKKVGDYLKGNAMYQALEEKVRPGHLGSPKEPGLTWTASSSHLAIMERPMGQEAIFSARRHGC